MEKEDIEKFIDLAFEEALKALKNNEVPIGAVIVNKEKIVVGKGHNQTETLKDSTAHAEILALKSASKKINDWRLDDHIIFSTIEPCEMCMGAIVEARIKEVYYDRNGFLYTGRIKALADAVREKGIKF